MRVYDLKVVQKQNKTFDDWQTGLVPAYLKLEYAGAPRYEHVASLFTIHNIP